MRKNQRVSTYREEQKLVRYGDERETSDLQSNERRMSCSWGLQSHEKSLENLRSRSPTERCPEVNRSACRRSLPTTHVNDGDNDNDDVRRFWSDDDDDAMRCATTPTVTVKSHRTRAGRLLRWSSHSWNSINLCKSRRGTVCLHAQGWLTGRPLTDWLTDRAAHSHMNIEIRSDLEGTTTRLTIGGPFVGGRAKVNRWPLKAVGYYDDGGGDDDICRPRWQTPISWSSWITTGSKH